MKKNKGRLNSEIVWCLLVWHFLTFHVLSNNIKVKKKLQVECPLFYDGVKLGLSH